MELVYRPVIALAKAMFALQGTTFTITGQENYPRTGGAVVAMNHISYLDFTYAGLAALPAKRLIRFMAKDAVFAHPVAGPFMRGMKHIPVDRLAGAGAFRSAVTALRAGELVGVFPEATISRSFDLKSFKFGAARMAAEAGVPIIPVITWGGQRMLTKGLPKRFGRTKVSVHIAVGEPIPVAPDADAKAVTEQLKTVMTRMLDEVRAAYPPMSGADLRFWPASLGGTAPTLAEANALDAADAAERIRRRREARGA